MPNLLHLCRCCGGCWAALLPGPAESRAAVPARVHLTRSPAPSPPWSPLPAGSESRPLSQTSLKSRARETWFSHFLWSSGLGLWSLEGKCHGTLIEQSVLC